MERVARRVLSQHGLRVQKAVCVNHIVRDESGNGLGPHRVVVSCNLALYFPLLACSVNLHVSQQPFLQPRCMRLKAAPTQENDSFVHARVLQYMTLTPQPQSTATLFDQRQ